MKNDDSKPLDLNEIDLSGAEHGEAIELNDINLDESKNKSKEPFKPSLTSISEETEEDLKEEEEEISNITSPKEIFSKITGIIDDSEDKKSERIAELKDDYQSDKGLSILGESALAIIDSENFNAEEKKQITGELSRQFSFIKNDDYPQKTDEEKTELASAALINTIGVSTIKENGEQDAELTKKMTDSFALGLKKSAPEITEEAEKFKKSHEADEEELKKKSSNNGKELSPKEAAAERQREEKFWGEATDLVRQAGKASLYLTLLLVVPPPANLVAVAAAFLFTRNMGVDQDKNKIVASENPQQEGMGVALDDQQENKHGPSVVIDNGNDPRNLSKATEKFVDENEMSDEKNQLETTKNALNQANDETKENGNKKPTISDKAKNAVKGIINSLKSTVTENKNGDKNNNSAIPDQANTNSSQSRQ